MKIEVHYREFGKYVLVLRDGPFVLQFCGRGDPADAFLRAAIAWCLAAIAVGMVIAFFAP